jgi:hypothetical protein
MSTHHAAALVHEAPQDVTAMLAHRPSEWLGAFLVLAARAVPDVRPACAGRPRFRVGRVQHTGDGGAVRAPFAWWPTPSPSVFRRFRGAFLVAPKPDGCELDLDGVADGGVPARNDQVLRALVDLIGEAIDADQPSPV